MDFGGEVGREKVGYGLVVDVGLAEGHLLLGGVEVFDVFDGCGVCVDVFLFFAFLVVGHVRTLIESRSACEGDLAGGG